MPLNFGHLEIFHAVAEAGSVSRAAERLMVSQPGVSKQLKQLEESLQTVLVDRLPRGIRLTAAGEALADYARRIFSLAGEAERVMGEMAGLRRGRLAVAATTTIGVYLLPPILVRYRRAYPGVEMRMEVQPTGSIQRIMKMGRIDVGLAESVVEDEAIESRVFMRDRLFPIAPPGHRLAKKGEISAEELCAEPFVVREVGSGGRSLVEEALGARGLGVEVAMSLGSTEAIKHAVMEGVGVAIVSGLAIAADVRIGRLARLKVKDLVVERPWYVLTPRGAHVSAAARAFIEMVGGLGRVEGRKRAR
ncbi:MAG TPA: LysR family transcriptional regulator [Tepidisphaeraceae bacterium]|nr:LysR family transcriptional regulator [Tepidisphaeraceae bacterium]